MKNKYKRFINIYEKEIKQYRDKYYKNIIQYSNTNTTYPTISFYLLPIIVSILILILLNFSIIGYLVSFLSIIVINYLLKITTNTFKMEAINEYKEQLKKHGYFSLEDYENQIKKIITGPGGYYETLQQELIEKYSINQNTRRITTTSGEEYYLWTNSTRDKIYLLNTRTTQKPEIKTIALADVRYFRIDHNKKSIIINTSKEDYFFKEDNLNIINEIMKEKRLENIKSFTPSIYIDDFEIYMNSLNTEEEKNNQEKIKEISATTNIIIACVICLIIFVAITNIIEKYQVILHAANILSLTIISSKLRKVLSIKVNKNKGDIEYINELNTNQECIERFEELKYVLGISNSYDRIYSKEGAEYLTWIANGYFHVFLNVIYFNVVYMSIKVSDVAYYKVENKICEIKLKDKKLEFTSDAENAFKKILPNKDYYWLKGYQNK